ncbi:CoA-dependent acyltransferase [Imleria badia]|nr:CoA-dependent acyltransferase [Imleria badia]
MKVPLRIQRALLRGPLLRTHFHTAHALLAARKVLHTFKLADIGEGITECEVIKWFVDPPFAPSAELALSHATCMQSFDALCEVQSDKASVEITSPFDGVVQQLLVQEGEIAKVGAGLCLIEVEEDDEHVDPKVNLDASTTPEETQDPAVSSVEEGDVEVIVSRTGNKHPLDPTNTASSTSFTSSTHALATPSVRHFARQQGVDIAALVLGSGRDGRVEKKDVEAFIARGRVVPGVVAESVVRTDDKDVVVELGRTRYGMWKAMTQSLEIPRFGYSTSLDLTRFHGVLPSLNANIPAHYLPPSSTPVRSRTSPMVNPSALHPAPAPPSIPDSATFAKLTYLPFLLKTLANSMMEWPLFRASISPTTDANANSKPTLTIRPTADVTLALSTPTGLYTPTIGAAQTLSIHGLASRVAHLAYLGRQVPCGLTPREMPRRGGTISVSNVGAIGQGEHASPVLVPGGGVAIVAIGRARWVWDVSDGVWDTTHGRGERRLKVDVSWSADHRVVEGAELAAFVETWRGWVENPERLIAEGV